MDRHLIEEKLESLRRCLERIRSRCPATSTILATDIDAQDIIALNPTRAVQLCVDIAAHLIAGQALPIPETQGEAFTRLHEAGLIDAETCAGLQKAVGFRNLAVHSYRDIDWTIVHRICHQHLDVFSRFARQVMRIIRPAPET